MNIAQERSLISLFAGGGGLDIGLEMAGFRAVVVNELEPHACSTLRENRFLSRLDPNQFSDWFERQMMQKCWRGAPQSSIKDLENLLRNSLPRAPFLRDAEIFEGDVRGLSSDTILRAGGLRRGEVCLVAGGPPCQPFSRAGKRQSMDVQDGRLFLEFVRIVSDVRPRWFLFENVKGLILTATDIVSYRCNACSHSWLASFEERGAHLSGSDLDSLCSKCGYNEAETVVTRKRGGSLDLILREFEALGYRCHHTVLNAADYGAPQMRERLIIVGSRDNESFAWPTRTHCGNSPRILPLFPEKSVSPWKTLKETLWAGGHPEYGPLDESKAVLWVKNVVRPHDEPVTWSLDRPSPTIGAHQSAKLAIAPYGVPVEQLARQQWHTLGRRQSDMPPVPVEHAYLSDVELLKLQTFPEDWYLYGTRMERAFQIGNAVPVCLAKVIGDSLMQASNYGEETNRKAGNF